MDLHAPRPSTFIRETVASPSALELNPMDLDAENSETGNPLQEGGIGIPSDILESMSKGGNDEVELIRDISKALNNYANKLQSIREQKQYPRVSKKPVDDMAAAGWTCFSDPGRWLRHQCMGWRPDAAGEYHGVWRRMQKAEFRKLFQGTDLDIEEVDEAIGTIAFVNALIITIPFAVAVGLTKGELDSLEALIEHCPSGSAGSHYDYGKVYGHYRFTMALLLYATMGCLTASVLYYIEKPKKSASKEHIQKWWRRGGRVVFVLMLISTAVSIWALLFQANWLLQFYSIGTNDFCDDVNKIYYQTGYFTTLLSFLVCFYLML